MREPRDDRQRAVENAWRTGRTKPADIAPAPKRPKKSLFRRLVAMLKKVTHE